MTELSQLSSLDMFFYYDTNIDNLDIEIEHDMIEGMIQPKRVMFYNRSEGCGICEKENYPNSLSLFVFLRYDITNWAAYRNTQVDDGVIGGKDRRVAVSQEFITFDKDNTGNLDVKVLYIPFKDFMKPQTITIPMLRS